MLAGTSFTPLSRRSLPGAVAQAAAAPPITVSTSTSTNSHLAMAKGGFLNFSKTIILPILVALAFYLTIFHFLLPLHHRHIARYSQYLPLTSTSTLTSRLPEALQPTTLRSTLTRLFLPTSWSARYQPHNRNNSFLSDHSSSSDNLFSAESGEAMVGFDIHEQRQRRRDGMERMASRGINAAREMGMGMSDSPNRGVDDEERGQIPPERRLSRELEEVFRDDSDEDAEDEENGVTVRRLSMSR